MLKKEANILVFLFVLCFILIVIQMMITAKIEVEIINMVINTQTKSHINNAYKMIFRLRIWGKIPIIKFTITKQKMRKIQKTINMQEKIEKLEKDIWQNRNKIDLKFWEIAKELRKAILIKKLYVNLECGTENAFLTAILVAIFSSILSMGISSLQVKQDEVNYKIEPIYIDQNFIKIAISGIFQLKLIHIINIIYVLSKKGGMKKYDRTSNRRSYDYSYE